MKNLNVLKSLHDFSPSIAIIENAKIQLKKNQESTFKNP